ncbi:MAG: cytochrome c [Gammaproteobacteria bacterium]|nr:cytochrome c [Gammaproteobacteria bacterium]
MGLLLLLLGLSTVTQAGDPFNGRTLYLKHCVQCHGEDGSGAVLAIPDLSRGEGLFKPDHMLVEALKQGLGTMPAYQGLLSDHELADLITYTRTLQ